MSRRTAALGLFLARALTPLLWGGQDDRSRLDFWKANYTELTPADDPRSGRAAEIFRRVVDAAGKRVMETSLKESKQSLEIRRHLDVLFGLDLIVHTPKRLKEHVDMGDWFLRDVLKEGKVLYEASRR